MPTPAATTPPLPRWKRTNSEMADSGEILFGNARGHFLECKN